MTYSEQVVVAFIGIGVAICGVVFLLNGKSVLSSGKYLVGVALVGNVKYYLVLESSVNELNVSEIPTIQFKMTINDKEDKPQKAWSVIIKQMPEDKSWW